MPTFRYPVMATLAVVSLACQSAPVGLSDADRAVLEKQVAESQTLVAAKNWDGYANLFVDDGVVLPPNGAPVKGRKAIADFLRAFPPISDFKSVIVTTDGRGDLAYTQGTYSMMLALPGAAGPTKDDGKWIVVSKKQADGSWKSVVEMFNSDLPIPQPAPAPAPDAAAAKGKKK